MLLKSNKSRNDATAAAKTDGLTDDPPPRPLARLATWAGVALAAAAMAVLAARSDSGGQRLARLFEPAPPPIAQRAEPQRQVVSDPMMLYETRRLADAVRALAAEREALADRVAAVERAAQERGTHGDITASIGRREPAAAPAAPREPQFAEREPQFASPTPQPRPGVRQVGAQLAAAASAPAAEPLVIPASPPAQPAQESTAMRTEFGVDIAGEMSVDALRARWHYLRAHHGPLLEGLRPLVAVQDGARPGAVDLRLIAGPLGNANAATRLCASLTTAGVNCKPAIFDGQRLALR